MPFCWGAVPLFDQNGALAPGGVASGNSKQVVSFSDLYRQEPNKLMDEDLYRYLTEIGKPGKYLEKLDPIFRHPSSQSITTEFKCQNFKLESQMVTCIDESSRDVMSPVP